MRIQAVFFDLFGTLLVAHDEAAAWDKWLDRLHIACVSAGVATDRARLSVEGSRFFELPEPVDDGFGLTVYERRIGRLLRELGAAPDRSTVVEAAGDSASTWIRCFAVDPAARNLLGELAGRVHLVLVSNFDHPPAARRALRESGLERFFAEVVISGEVGPKKPDPGIFRGPLERLGLAPSEVAHVGDAEEDVRGALAAGLRPILLRRDGVGGGGSSSRDGGAVDPGVTVISTLAELRTLLT